MEYSVRNKKVLDKKRGARIGIMIYNILKSIVPNDALVLDIGCSSGIVSEYLAERFGSVVGIDIDQSSIKIAKRTKEANLKFLFMDATNLKFEDCTFDLVILSQVHYYFKNQKKLFDGVYRVLKPGGAVFLSGTNKHRMIKPFEPVPTYYKSFWELKKLLNKFEVNYQTKEVVGKNFPLLKLVPRQLFNMFEPLSPNFVWVLMKK